MSRRVALQLYTLRDEPDDRLSDVLARLSALGFEGVESAGYLGLGPAEFCRRCDQHGLAVPAAHLQSSIEDRETSELEGLAEAGVTTCVIPMLGAGVFADRSRILRAVDHIHRCAERAQSLGIRLGYHNHEWEFEQRIDGVPAHHVLFEALDPAIFAEIDVYWAQVGGVDPAEEIARLGRRATLLHLKDGPASDSEAPMTALGQGRVDLPRVLRCSQAEWHILEIDRCEGDVWDAIEASAAYLAAQ